MKRANCVVSITCVKIVHGVAPVLVPVLADRNPVASNPEQVVNLLVARWVPMQHTPVLEPRVAMPDRPSVKNARITLARAMTILVIVLKARGLHALLGIARKVIVRHFKIVAHVRKLTALKVIVLLIKTVVHALKADRHKANVHLIKIVGRVRRVAPIVTRPNSVVGMCPMVSIPAHG